MFLSVEASLKKLKTSYIDIVSDAREYRNEHELTEGIAVPSLVGPHSFDRRGDAQPQHARRPRQDSLPRRIRHASLNCV